MLLLSNPTFIRINEKDYIEIEWEDRFDELYIIHKETGWHEYNFGLGRVIANFHLNVIWSS